MTNDTEFKVGQYVRFNHIWTSLIDDGRGAPTPYNTKEVCVGKITQIFPKNKRKIEVLIRGDDPTYVRVHPRNVIEILPEDAIILTRKEQADKEFGELHYNICQFQHLSPFGQEEVIKHLKAVNELFNSKLVNSALM